MSEKHPLVGEVTGYAEKLGASLGSNRDTHGLGAMRIGNFIVGSVGPINGEDGREVSEFLATRYELKQLARSWFLERVEVDYDYFVDQCSGSSEWRWGVFISRRLNRLDEILGQEAMKEAQQDAVNTFRHLHPGISDEDWRVFMNGSEEEQEAWRTRLWEETAKRWKSEECAASS